MAERAPSPERLAELYDVLNPWGPGDDFYLGLVMAAEAVLDVGYGTGGLLHRAREAGHRGRLCGLDPDEAMLSRARRRSDVEWVGGKDNYPVDREAGDDYQAIYPEIVDVARASRRFLTRAVRYLAGEAGVRQFLDIGTGLPTADNTHEVAQRVAPDARVVYVDRL